MKALRTRRVLVTIDTLTDMLKDYLSAEDMPFDAMPIKMMVNPTENGKIAILMTSNDFPADAPNYSVRFDIKKVYGF